MLCLTPSSGYFGIPEDTYTCKQKPHRTSHRGPGSPVPVHPWHQQMALTSKGRTPAGNPGGPSHLQSVVNVQKTTAFPQGQQRSCAVSSWLWKMLLKIIDKWGPASASTVYCKYLSTMISYPLFPISGADDCRKLGFIFQMPLEEGKWELPRCSDISIQCGEIHVWTMV